MSAVQQYSQTVLVKIVKRQEGVELDDAQEHIVHLI